MARRRALSPMEKLHSDWLGMLRPEGLVVSVPVLLEADAYVRQAPEVQAAFRDLAPEDRLADWRTFERVLTEILGWPRNRLADVAALEMLAVALPDLGVVLRPDGALLDREGAPLLYFSWTDDKLDDAAGDTRWPVSRQGRFERLLLESQTSSGGGTAIGVHACPTAMRVTYAPRGEAPGSLTFPIDALCTWDGRVLVDALVMLLGKDRLFTVAAEHRLRGLLAASRKRQEQVTVSLAGQVEEALAILVAGLDVANSRTRGALLRDLGDDSAPAVRDALVTSLLRLVFLLYCEDGRVLPMDHPLYLDNYSLARLVEKLEEDRVLYPEAMRHRYGAWARLCALFRLVHSGIRHGDLVLPPREGDLFDPNRHPFLEGRVSEHDEGGTLAPVDDGVVLDVLERLVYLENQRLSYRNLDVEQIGSVYEALMGLEVRRVATRTVPVRGAGWLELAEALDNDQPLRAVAAATGLREKDVLKRAPGLADFEVTGDRTGDEARLVIALGSLLDDNRGERRSGQHVLVGGAERRRTGSHYTPTTLTRPIVERTLGPVLDVDGPPTAGRILDMKVCDPAMGSGAFLAEACRYLGRRLLDAWIREGNLPVQARERDPLLLARRQVAEQCLYGVDKNPFAVQLARLSLWLVTLAKDQPFTFVDHALREGDSVIGLTSEQIAAFSFEPPKKQDNLFAHAIRRSIKDAIRDRAHITAAAPLFDFRDEHRWKVQYLTRAQDEIHTGRRRGDLLLALAWAGSKGKEAKQREGRVRSSADNYFISDGDKGLSEEADGLLAVLPLRPFHWELEFPEVFGRENPGFDALVGNPPFGGKNTILATGGDRIIEVFKLLRPHAHGNADFCSWFFLRAASVLRKGGCFGLVATNTIKQGDTRATGLQHLVVQEGVTPYDATTDLPWPVLGGAAVVVDVVHACRGAGPHERLLNGQVVDSINSGLAAGPELPDPVALSGNEGCGFIGSYVLGTGFVLEPSEARALIDADPRNAEIVKPYIGGEELNSNLPGPDGMVAFSRWVIDFGDRSLEMAAEWPTLIGIVRERVKPQRDNDNRAVRRERWWQFGERAPALYAALRPLRRALVTARVSKHHVFAFQPTGRVFSEALVVLTRDDPFSFALLQSRTHEAWARGAGLGSTMKTDARYTPSTIFETFPFPRPAASVRIAAAAAGEALDNQRAVCMRRFGEGMTKIWNRLLSPDEMDPEIVKLRELRDEMDRAVLVAYGWEGLAPDDTDEIVTRLRALNVRRAAEEKRSS
jgi:hypothetical protein